MKSVIVILTTVLLSVTAFAQAPQKMSYQAVIRNSSNSLVTSSMVGMQISILQGSANGAPVYVETRSPITNANGLVTMEIGSGTIVSGTFAAINWANGPYFIKTETDPTGGTTYTITGTSQLLSVPYALHAKTAETITGGITETDPVFVASPANGITSTGITHWNTAYGWGNHANAGYLTNYSETDPLWSAAIGNYYTKTNLQTSGAAQVHFNNLTNKPATVADYGITDAMTTTHIANSITSINIANWTTAFSWGNHAGLYRPIGYVPAWSDITGKPNFATVATSGNYSDLSNKPTTDGSETKVTAGTNTSITGTGTSGSPYVINSTGSSTPSLQMRYCIALSGVFPSQSSGGSASPNTYIGEIKLFPYGFVPDGWALCDGSVLSIAQNTALFSLIGTMYGGNGSTNFALPNITNKVVIGQ